MAEQCGFTEAELHKLNLPGFGSIGTLRQVLHPDADWQYAHALTVVAEMPVTKGDAPQPHVLRMTHRDQADAWRPHIANSLPDKWLFDFAYDARGQRTSRAAGLLLEKQSHLITPNHPVTKVAPLTEVESSKPQIIANFAGNRERIDDRARILPRLAQTILCKTLLTPDIFPDDPTMLPDEPIGMVSLSKIARNVCRVGDRGGEPVYMPVVLASSVVHWYRPETIPRTALAYRQLSWVPVKKFYAAMADAASSADLVTTYITDGGLSRACVHGLATAMSAAVLQSRAELQSHTGLTVDT